MTLPALTTPTRAPTLEDRREAITQTDHSQNEMRKAQAHEVHKLRLSWGLLYPRSSTREFITWLGYGEFHSRWYGYLRAGLAREAGLDVAGLLFGTLTAYGERLEHGELPADILSGAPSKVPEKTSIRVTRETADALDATFAELSESDARLTRQDALETTVQAFAHAPPAIRRALVHSAATGENPLDALIRAVDERRDWRAWLSRQPCAVPACGVKPVELHHVRVGANDRYRTNEVLLPCCTRHHIARPGDATDAAHTGQDEWVRRHWGDYGQFWQAVALLYVRYAAESDSPQEVQG